jgi:hypothetical protein
LQNYYLSVQSGYGQSKWTTEKAAGRSAGGTDGDSANYSREAEFFGGGAGIRFVSVRMATGPAEYRRAARLAKKVIAFIVTRPQFDDKIKKMDPPEVEPGRMSL